MYKVGDIFFIREIREIFALTLILFLLKGLLTAVISSDPAIEEAVMGALDPNNEMTLADITGDIASGFDTIQNDYGDILNDPTQEYFFKVIRYN